MQDPKIDKNSPSGHYRTTLSGYIFATKACINNRKNLLNSNIPSTCPHGELRHTNGWDRFGSLRHPCKFHRVSSLGSVTAWHLVVGVSRTLRRWTEGATCIRQCGHHVGHWPTFLVIFELLSLFHGHEQAMATGVSPSVDQPRGTVYLWHCGQVMLRRPSEDIWRHSCLTVLTIVVYNCRQLGYHTAISADIAHLWPLRDLALYNCP